MSTTKDSPVTFRKPVAADGATVHALIDACKPLDLNSPYNYMLLCSHFAETCVIGEKDGEMVAFVSAYLPPDRKNTVFIWQVAVSAAGRGQGVGKKLLKEVLARPACKGVTMLETTVTPSNEASRGMFYSLAKDLGVSVNEEVFFPGEFFAEKNHEDEVMLRIGPFTAR